MITKYAFPLTALAVLALGAASAGAAERGPGTADFSRPVPSVEQLRQPTAASQRAAERRNGYGVEGPVLYRSAPAEAPRRFDLVGVAGEMHALEFRARREGGPWSDWVESDNGDPVYTGGSDEVQVRSRGVPIEGRLHYVRVESTGAPAPSPRPLARETPRRSVPAPDYVTRAEWGANLKVGGCPPRIAPVTGRVKAGAIHHTVTTNTYTKLEAPAIVLGICRYHVYANDWNDIGYNALVDRFGNLYEGRAGGMARPIMGAHAEGVNSQTTGIATIGDHRAKTATRRERRMIVKFLAWKFDLAGIAAAGRTRLLSSGGSSARASHGERLRVTPVFSHSYTNYTECAGTALRAQIPQIRRAVQRRLDHYPVGAPVVPPEPVEPPVVPVDPPTPEPVRTP